MLPAPIEQAPRRPSVPAAQVERSGSAGSAGDGVAPSDRLSGRLLGLPGERIAGKAGGTAGKISWALRPIGSESSFIMTPPR